MQIGSETRGAAAPARRHRRPAQFNQAEISRALRAAQSAGPAWHVEIEGNVIRLFQCEADATASHVPEQSFARGLGIVP